MTVGLPPQDATAGIRENTKYCSAQMYIISAPTGRSNTKLLALSENTPQPAASVNERPGFRAFPDKNPPVGKPLAPSACPWTNWAGSNILEDRAPSPTLDEAGARRRAMPLQLGDTVPDFVLSDRQGRPVRLGEMVDGPVVLIFLRHLA